MLFAGARVGNSRQWHASYGERAHQDTIPKESVGVFIVQGYGAPLVRRLLCQLKWRETAVDNLKKPQLLWAGSALANELREVQRPWQMVSHFPRGGSMGSKSCLLQNLRALCDKGEAQPLMSFFPRAYDLRNHSELYAFILDFAVTRAEAVLRKISARNIGASDCQHILAATRLLDRLTPLLEKEIRTINSVARTKGTKTSEMVPLSATELAVVTSTDWSALEVDAVAPVPNSPEAALLAALKMEMRWWLDHLEKAPYRQFQFNGKQAFWILKEPALNCGRGVSVFCDLLPLLAHAQVGSWDFVVQKYLERPLLIGSDRRKCDVRLWVLITSWNPAVVWVWSEPYLRLASRPFSWSQEHVTNPFVHLTNRAVQKEDGEKRGCNQLVEDEEHIWMLSSFFNWAAAGCHRTPDGTALSDRWVGHTWPSMLNAVRACVRSCQIDVGYHHPGCFELFGFDFLLDEDLEPWLLEANSSPDLCEDGGPSLRKLTEGAMTELLNLVPALHSGSVNMPSDIGKPECDLRVEGSGRWHLCLLERKQCVAKEMELKRILKPCPHSAKFGGLLGRPFFATENFEALRCVLGSQQASLLPAYAPNQDVCKKRSRSTRAAGRCSPLKGLPRKNLANVVDKVISDDIVTTQPVALQQLKNGLLLSRPTMHAWPGRRARSFSRTR